MAKFELPIYGENDEIIKTHSTNIVPWAIFIQAAELDEKTEKMSTLERLQSIGELLKAVFMGLTDEELLRADTGDVMNTFKQIVSGGQTIKGGGGKNA